MSVLLYGERKSLLPRVAAAVVNCGFLSITGRVARKAIYLEGVLYPHNNDYSRNSNETTQLVNVKETVTHRLKSI